MYRRLIVGRIIVTSTRLYSSLLIDGGVDMRMYLARSYRLLALRRRILYIREPVVHSRAGKFRCACSCFSYDNHLLPGFNGSPARRIIL